jgi:tetratricopeptide (TPR) repeat protein
LAFHCSEIGVFAHRAGETETALAFLRDGVRAYREHGPQEHLVMTLFNLGSVEISAGALADAAANCAEALELAAPDDKTGKRNALAFAGYAAMLRGDLEHAERAFKEADAIEKRRAGLDLNADLGIQWAEHLICAGDLLRARQLTETNAEICKRNDWHLQIAMCEWIFAWLDTLEGHFPSAHAHLDRAKDTFTSGHMIRDLARTLLTESECLLAEGNHAAAGASCERALQLAAPRSYRLIHSDALNLRARIRLSQSPADPLAASDDAEAALQIARPCEYYWAERDALGLLTRAHHLLNDSAKAQKYAVERDRLKPLRRPSSSEQAGLSA